MTKYKEYFDRMISDNKDLFDEFKQIHDRYGMEQDKLQGEFNKVGAKIQTVIRQRRINYVDEAKEADMRVLLEAWHKNFKMKYERYSPLLIALA